MSLVFRTCKSFLPACLHEQRKKIGTSFQISVAVLLPGEKPERVTVGNRSLGTFKVPLLFLNYIHAYKHVREIPREQ